MALTLYLPGKHKLEFFQVKKYTIYKRRYTSENIYTFHVTRRALVALEGKTAADYRKLAVIQEHKRNFDKAKALLEKASALE